MNLWFMNLLNVGGPAMLATWVFWVIFSVVLHELAHGWTAVRCGDRTPIELGHLTWNPVVHMGTSGVLMMALLGVTWGRMPIDPTRMRRWYDEVLVTAAGPLTNLGLSVLCILVVVGYAAATKGQGAASEKVAMFFGIGAILNMVLAILNMLPLFPLDGGRILGVFVPPLARFYASPTGAMMSMVTLSLVFVFGGDIVFPAAFRAMEFIQAAAMKLFGAG
jgi:Zn-dependent protease